MEVHCWVCRSELKDGKCINCGYNQAELKKIEITPSEVKAKLDKKEDFLFIDVRTPEEVKIVSIDGTQNIQLSSLPFSSLQKKEIIIHCHHGVRSLHAANFLAQKGYNAKSMKGGIDAWSLDIDSSIKRY